MNSKPLYILSRLAYNLFVPILFLICAIGITCINIDPVFCFASLRLCLGTAGPVDAGPCLCFFSLRGSAAWLGLYYVTYWYLGVLANSLIIGQPARLRSQILLFCWPKYFLLGVSCARTCGILSVTRLFVNFACAPG